MPCFDPIINNDCKINNLNLLSLRSKKFSHDVTAVLFGSSQRRILSPLRSYYYYYYYYYYYFMETFCAV